LMWKHILFQGIITLVLMLLMYGYAHHYVPETSEGQKAIAKQLYECFGVVPGQKVGDVPNYDLIIAGPAIHWPHATMKLPDASSAQCGVFSDSHNLEFAHKKFIGFYGSTHLTLIFNTFVIYNLFNQINARVIDDGFNIFSNLHKNWLFIIITFAEFGLHFLIIQYTGLIFKVSIHGLDYFQWGLSFIIGCSAIFIAVILKLRPVTWLSNHLLNFAQYIWSTKCGCKKKAEGEEEEERDEIDILEEYELKKDDERKNKDKAIISKIKPKDSMKKKPPTSKNYLENHIEEMGVKKLEPFINRED